jgi:hypothetical protein
LACQTDAVQNKAGAVQQNERKVNRRQTDRNSAE